MSTYKRANLLLLIALLIFDLSNSYAQSSNVSEILIANQWKCVLEEGGMDITLIIHFKETESDSLECLIDVPESGFSELPNGPLLPEGNSIKMNGFSGVYNKSEDKIIGKSNWYGQNLSVEMSRVVQYPEHVVNCPIKVADWMFKTNGPIWSSPTVHQGLLIFGNDEGMLYAVNIDTKEPAWTFQCDDAIRSKAVISDNKLVFVSDDGFLYSLKADSGELSWKRDIGNNDLPRILPQPTLYAYDIFCSSPVIHNERIFVGSIDSCVYALSLSDGQILWKNKTGGNIRSTPTVDGSNVYVGSWDNHMYAFDQESGNEIWKYNASGWIQSSPLVVGDRLIFGSRGAYLFALDSNTGTEIWKRQFWSSWVESSPVLFDGTVYIGSSDYRKVFALDPESGMPLWKFQTEGWAWPTPAVSLQSVFIGIVGNADYANGMPGKFYALDRKTGEAKWQVVYEGNKDHFTFGFGSSPVYHQGRVYFGGSEGIMYGVDE